MNYLDRLRESLVPAHLSDGGTQSRPLLSSKESAVESEVVLLTPAMRASWRKPPFQRETRETPKVLAVAHYIKEHEVIPGGPITLGRLADGPSDRWYVLDGAHRLAAFKIANRPEVLCEVRRVVVASMREMAEQFIMMNSRLVNMRPDDILRGYEETNKSLRDLRKRFSFIGYDQIRRRTDSPIVGMATLLRSWRNSANDTPRSTGVSASQLGETFGPEDAEQLAAFVTEAQAAWKRDPEYLRLWNAVNLIMCMWLWRRLVVDQERGVKRYVALTPAKFRACLYAIARNADYLDWLKGRARLSEHERSPCYRRLARIFRDELGGSTKMPQPEWLS